MLTQIREHQTALENYFYLGKTAAGLALLLVPLETTLAQMYPEFRKEVRIAIEKLLDQVGDEVYEDQADYYSRIKGSENN